MCLWPAISEALWGLAVVTMAVLGLSPAIGSELLVAMPLTL